MVLLIMSVLRLGLDTLRLVQMISVPGLSRSLCRGFVPVLVLALMTLTLSCFVFSRPRRATSHHPIVSPTFIRSVTAQSAPGLRRAPVTGQMRPQMLHVLQVEILLTLILRSWAQSTSRRRRMIQCRTQAQCTASSQVSKRCASRLGLYTIHPCDPHTQFHRVGTVAV